jgi:tetratricopeptide (TPR) repeat protein
LNSLGKCYIKASKHQEALDTYKKIYEIETSRENKETLNIASALINMGMVNKMMNNFNDYASNFEKGMRMA